MKKIYVLGSLNCDLTIRAPYLPAAGETLKGSDFLMTAGGKGANQAYACASLGGNVHMAGAVGNDAFGELLLNGLKNVGVDCTYVRKAPTATGVAVITVIDGDNRIILSEGANACVSQEDVDGLLNQTLPQDVFIAQLENPLPIVKYALKKAKAKGLHTVLNPAPAKQEARELVEYCDLVIPNEKELALLTEKDNLEEGCKTLLSWGVKEVLVTLGGEGSLYYSQKGKARIDSVRVGEVVDTTAAGDTFCGALCVRLSEGAPILEAARFASLCAGISVTRRGAQISIPSREEINRYQS